jgi:predicted enzyme related to lactoylglutathione lyase
MSTGPVWPPGLSGVVYVVDLDRMAAFYEAVCGLDVVERADDDFVTLETPTLSLSLVQAPPWLAAQVVIADPPERREDAALKFSFPVASLDRVRELAPQFGGTLDDPGTEWEFRGCRVCHGADPEGNVVSFRQPV